MNAKLLSSTKINYRLFLACFSAFCLLALPDIAAASGGITEFSSPLERVVNTITGPAGKWISIVAMALCGVIFIMNKDDISGGFKLLLSVVFGISFMRHTGVRHHRYLYQLQHQPCAVAGPHNQCGATDQRHQAIPGGC